MKKILIFTTILLGLVLNTSCHKDEPIENTYKPVFDKSTKNFTDFDKNNARYLLTHWQLKTEVVKDNKGNVLKLVGYTHAENGGGKAYNIIENTVGRKPVYVYFKMYLNFEARTIKHAEIIRDACVHYTTKETIYALIKNVAKPEFNIERDLPFLQEEISNTYIKLISDKVQNHINSGNIKY